MELPEVGGSCLGYQKAINIGACIDGSAWKSFSVCTEEHGAPSGAHEMAVY